VGGGASWLARGGPRKPFRGFIGFVRFVRFVRMLLLGVSGVGWGWPALAPIRSVRSFGRVGLAAPTACPTEPNATRGAAHESAGSARGAVHKSRRCYGCRVPGPGVAGRPRYGPNGIVRARAPRAPAVPGGDRLDYLAQMVPPQSEDVHPWSQASCAPCWKGQTYAFRGRTMGARLCQIAGHHRTVHRVVLPSRNMSASYRRLCPMRGQKR
jgi:hypothetical protein